MEQSESEVLLLLEGLTYGVSLFEVMSHLIFFLVLSRSFRATARTYLPCHQDKQSSHMDAHTLHTVQDQRQLPRKAAKNLTVEDLN